MAAPIPSFFKMRLVIFAVLVLLGFFFIGLLNRAFAASCDPYSVPDNAYSSEEYSTQEEAHQACIDHFGGITAESPCDYDFCVNNPDYYTCYYHSSAGNDYYRYACVACVDENQAAFSRTCDPNKT